MFLMPSRYEPCGLGQLISYKYGTIPIVRATGGLADTVRDFDPRSEQGDGFVFKEYQSAALLKEIQRAVESYRNRRLWERLQIKVMHYDYSWETSARKYVALYRKAIEKIEIK